MSHEIIPLVLYGLGATLLIGVAWVDWSDQNQEVQTVSRGR